MADPNESDGSWEFVDKDSDSETSSIGHSYDTGLPDEPFNVAGGEEEVEPVGWTNNEDDVTDSDIEACTEEVVESETEERLQKPVDSSQVLADSYSCSSDMEQTQQEEDAQPDQHLDHTTGSDMPNVPCNNTDIDVEDPDLNNGDPNQGERPQSTTEDESDDITNEETIEEVAHQGNDVPVEPNDDPDEQTEGISTTAQLAEIDSSDSEYEKLESNKNSDSGEELSSESENVALPELNDSQMVASVVCCPVCSYTESDDTGSSSDFTVIDATCQDPKEDGIIDLGTSSVSSSHEVATATHRTIGMVTDRPKATGLRFKISFIVISFGVGFVLGFRYPQNESPIVLRHEDSPATLRAEEMTETCSGRGDVGFSADDYLRNEGIHTLHDGHIAVMKKLNENTAALRELRERTVHLKSAKAKLQGEIARTRYVNRQMKFRYEHMMEENKRLEKEKASYERSLRTHQMLRTSCEKQEIESKMQILAQDKEIQRLKKRITSIEQENIFFNRTMTLYQRLQSQHHKLLELNRESANSHKSEIARHESQIRRLKKQLGSCRFKLLYLERKSDTTAQSGIVVIKRPIPGEPISPLLQTIAAEQDSQSTCPSGSKYRAQFRALKRKMVAQKSQIKKLSESNSLKSLAVEILYHNFRSLSDLVNCVNQRVKVFTGEGAGDPLSFCRGLTEQQTKEAKPGISAYEVHGTITLDLKSLDLELDLDLTLNDQNISQYSMKIAAQPCDLSNATPSFFDSPFFVNLTAPVKVSKTPKLPLCKFNEYDQVNSSAIVPVTTSDLVPAALYKQAQAMVYRSRYQVARYRSDLWMKNKMCSANEHALITSIQQAENATNSLYVATEEVQNLRKQRSELKEMLRNVTTELMEIKKPSAKQCFKQILGTEELMKKISNSSSKSYNAIKTYAKAVENVSKRAWMDMLKYVDHLKTMTTEKNSGKEYKDDSTISDHKDDDNKELEEEDDCQSKNRWIRRQCEKSKRQERKEKKKREREERKEKKKEDKKAWKIKKEKFSTKLKRFHGEVASKIQKKLNWAVDKGKKLLDKAKTIIHPAEVKVGNKILKWVPLEKIFPGNTESMEKTEKVFRWKRSEEVHAEAKYSEELSAKQEEKPGKEMAVTEIHPQLFSNETIDHKPLLFDQSSKFMLEQKFGPVMFDQQAVDGNLLIYHQTSEKTSRDEEGPKSNKKESPDPLWFSKMFEERKKLREKGYGVGRFTEDEFDWFLKMFEAREKMRKNSDSYSSADNDKDWFLEMFESRAKLRFIAEKERDNTDQKNWFLKMSEARDKSRSKGEKGNVDWYINMHKARDEIREKTHSKWLSGHNGRKDENWYSKRGKSRQHQRDEVDESRGEVRGVRLDRHKTKPSTFDNKSNVGRTIVR